jgi:hypothetical protein
LSTVACACHKLSLHTGFAGRSWQGVVPQKSNPAFLATK